MRAGFRGSFHYILLLALSIAVLFRIGMVLAAGIDQVYLLSPANATWSNQDNDTMIFYFNYTGSNESASCVLSVSNLSYLVIPVAMNDSVLKNTTTALQSNASIAEGWNYWRVNCTNGTFVPSATYVLKIDRTEPKIQINAPWNSTINSDAFNFNYNETGLKCSWYSVDGTTNITNCSIAGNSWTGTFPSLSDGPHYVAVWANDSAGNENSTILYWTRDATPPSINVGSPLNQTYNVSLMWFNVTTDEPANVCFVEQGPWYLYYGNFTMTNSSGNWNYKNETMNEGTSSYWSRFYCNDTAGNWNSTEIVYFTIDTTPPNLTISSPQNFTANDSFYFFYLGGGVNCSWYSLDGDSNVTNCSITNNFWQGTFPALSSGQHNVTVWANDSVGNINSTFRNFTKYTPISMTILSPSNITYNTTSIWFNVSASQNTDTCLVQNGPIYDWGQNHSMTNSSGNWNYLNNSVECCDFHNFRARFYCNNTEGFWNSTDYVYFSIDTTPPNIVINSPLNASTNNDSFYFTYSGGANCSWYSLDGDANVTNCSVYLFNSWIGTFAGLSDGPHNVRVWANDSVGNTNSSVRYWTRDNVPPPVFIFSPQNITYNTTNISLNVSSDGTESAWKYSLNGAGNQTFAPNTTITAQYGSNTLAVFVNDNAGNVNFSSVVFYVNHTAPRLESPMHNVSGDGGWGETHYFNVTCWVPDGGNATLYFWYMRPSSGYWSLRGQQNCSGATPHNYTFTISNFVCDDVTPAGQNSSFMFNASAGSLVNQTDSQNFTISKDDVSLMVFDDGDNSNPSVWRNGSAYFNLSVSVWDTDTVQPLTSGNATFWVTINGSDMNSWNTGNYAQVRTDGYANYTFLNDSQMPIHECNYTIGIHKWKAGIGGINQDSCYKETNSSVYNLTIQGELRPVITSPTGTRGFIVGDLINLSGYVDDDCSYRTGQKVDGADIDTSSPLQRFVLKTGITTRYCTVDSEGGGWYNCSWDSTGQSRAKWNITMTVNKSYYNVNSTTEVEAFHLGTMPEVFNPAASPSSGGWGNQFAFSVYFGDADSDSNNVSFWLSNDNATWRIYNSTAVSSSGRYITFYQYFNCSEMGTLYYKFNTTDPYNYTAETSPDTFNITANNVTVTINSSLSSQNVSILNDTATLVFRIYDSINGTYPNGAGGIVWVTENGQDYTKILGCTTSGGLCQVSYNPNASASGVGTQYWKAGANDTCYQHSNSTNQSLLVTNPITSVALSPHAVINGSEVRLFASHSANSVWLWANVTLPSTAVQRVSLANGSNTSFYSTNLTGRYNVTFFANDTLGELIVNGTDYFESFQPLLFNASVISQNSSGVNSSFVFYYRNESLTTNASSNGSFSGQIVRSVLDMEVRCYGERLGVLLRNVNASSENNKALGIDRHTESGGYLLTYGVNNTYNITSATVTIHYDDIAYSDEGNLQLHKCNNYNFSSRTCSGSWSDVTANATHNTTGHYFVLNVTSFSGFAIMQYVAASSPPSGSSTASQPAPGCTMNWSCGAWGPCQPGGTETRTCTDKGSCRTANRTESRSCAYLAPVSCADNLLNGGESDVDCGGICPPCTNGKVCRASGDCQSNSCESSVCKAPSSSGAAIENPAAGKQERPWIFDAGTLLLSVLLTVIIILIVFSFVEILAPKKGETDDLYEANA